MCPTDMESNEKPVDGVPTSNAMTYDDILKRLGEFGPYQRRVYFLLCLAVIPCSFHKLAGVFLAAQPDHRCLLPYEDKNATFHQSASVQNLTRVWDDFANDWSKCQRRDGNFTDEYFDQGVPYNASVPCSSWVFDMSDSLYSSVIEFSLICNRIWLRATADSLFMVGVLLGSYIFGDLSDRYGRRPTFIISLIIQLIGGLLTAMAPEYISFVLGRILIGASTSGVFLVAYVIAMEMVGPSKRLIAGTVVHMFFSIGFLLIALIAYVSEKYQYSWRVFQVVITLFPGLFLMSYWWIIPESSRWLNSKGRHQEAKAILLKVAKENKVDLPESALDSLLNPQPEKSAEDCDNEELEEEALSNGMGEHLDKGAKKEMEAAVVVSKKQATLLDLMRYPSLRRRSLNIFFNWFVCSLVYYGLSWSTSDLGGNKYLNFCLSGIMEFPGYGILIFTLNRFGRKITLCAALLAGGVFLLLTTFVPADMRWLSVSLAMLGKLAITSAYGTIYVFSTEQFPTVVRNVALGAGSMSARIGGIVVSYVNQLAYYWRPLPMIIFGSFAFVAGGMALLLPETLNRTLPETIEEGEAFVEKPKNKTFVRKNKPDAEAAA